LIVVAAPVHAGLVGGDAAKVLPAVAQVIGHALTLIDNGGLPESKTGDGRVLGLVVGLNLSVEGSIAYCQVPLASNSRSAAKACWEFRLSTFWVLGMSKA